MAAVVLALAASACWGVSDFLGGLRTRAFPVLAVLAVSAPPGLVAIALVVAARGERPPSGLFWLWGALAGVGGAIGIAALYKGLAVGRMGVVAPITATSPLIPVVVGLARGERPSTIQYAGMAVALVGVVLAAREVEKGPLHGRVAAGVGFALVAFIGFGSTQLAIDAASNDDPYWATLMLRAAFTVVLVLAFLVTRTAFPGRSVLPSLVAIGILDVGATLLFAISTSKGLVSVVAVLGSLFPVIVIVLARVVLHERLARIQYAGGAIALAGAALISAG